MRTESTISVKREWDYDFRALRLLANGNQVCALLLNHRGGWRNLRFVIRFIWRQGSGYIGGKTISLAWRSDSRDWARVHRGQRKGLFGVELTTRANGPYISR